MCFKKESKICTDYGIKEKKRKFTQKAYNQRLQTVYYLIQTLLNIIFNPYFHIKFEHFFFPTKFKLYLTQKYLFFLFDRFKWQNQILAIKLASIIYIFGNIFNCFIDPIDSFVCFNVLSNVHNFFIFIIISYFVLWCCCLSNYN